MNRAEIREKLNSIIRDSGRDASGLPDKTRLQDDLGMTSIELLYMVIVIEESFGIEFKDVSVNDFRTLSDVMDYIQNYKK